ncbi:telomerase protein component 1-like [Sinocyclocheilus grahami]|uniref:telomerase protein component 1-like n=1 Tax=Sinocyclocheilus grahami TaxID=75366 RepID=UPI0007AD2632|nr:PREDICTED: telomerase protein component 1-like [Sinocyclocheilus grahami]
MKASAPLQTEMKANTDARLQRNYSSSRLENRFLAQAPSVLSQHQHTSPSWAKQTSISSQCPALQPTSLSSTMATSSLLSSTTMSSQSSSSSLLSTKNTLLMEPSLHFPVSSSLTSSYSHNPLLSYSKMSTPSAAPPLCSYPSPSMENKAGSNEKRKVEDMLFSPEGLLGSSEEPRQDASHESLEEDDQKLSSEMPVLNMNLDGKGEQTLAPHEEFGVLEASEDEHLVELRDRKNILLNMVCCSLVNKSFTPGQKDWDKKRSVWAVIKVLATEITTEDPEFLLKVAVYTRQELNLHITANFLLALAAHLPGSKPHLRRYFCAAVQLPSDWLEVTRIYSTCFSKSLPSCLKKALVDKFKQFTEYQLAKYNTRKHRCKHNKKLKKGEKISAAQWKKWGNLPGRTLVMYNAIISEDRDWSGANVVCLPPESTDNIDENKLSASEQEAAMLLCLMINYCSEDSQVMLFSHQGLQEVKVKSDVLLDNVRQAMKQLKDLNAYYVQSECISRAAFFAKLSEEKTKLDRIVVFESYYTNVDLMAEINNYRQINHDTVVIRVLLRKMSPIYTLKYKLSSNIIELWGFSEQILKFVSERGSSRMLQHVEHMDRVYNIPPPQGRKIEPERTADVILLPATPKLRWKGVRVFISSTFRDMHAERDVLVRSVFPELRRRAALHYLYLQEVELRWGVTEEESNRAVELCLWEVCRSQLLLGILGERYGLVPPCPTLPELPQYSWLNSVPDGLSSTEMEIRQFQALYPDSAQSRMFFYFRSPRLTSSVPVAWRTDFVAESKEAEAKMNSLKTWIRNNDFKVAENYPCEWGGVVDGTPYLKGLEDFGKAALVDIWEAIQQLFVKETDEDVASEIKEQEVHQDAQQRQFHGRAKLISMATAKVQECQQKGGVLMVEGNPGEGKTVFMAALSQALKTSVKNKKAPLCDVISYSTDASQSACRIVQLLRCLVQWLRKRKDDVELPPNTYYKDLLSEFHLNLNEFNKKKPLALLVDGADHIHDGRGQRVSEWIPQHIPKGVCLVLSVTSESSLRNTLSKSKGTVSFPLGQLSFSDKNEIVQKQLVEFGKKLSDYAFNKQLQTLLMKKGSVSPLYLRLACEELKNYASFEKMKDSLQSLPQSVGKLVQHSLLKLQNQYCRADLGWALASLAISSTGLRESSLYTILNMCNDLNSRGGLVTWQEILHIARHPESRVPMAVFSQLARTLHSLIGPSHGQGSDDLLILTHPEVKSAFEHLYLSTEESRTRSHLIIAAHLWVQSNPQGKDTFLHSDADILSQLPAHLMGSNQWETLCFLLSSYCFLYANVRHGLIHQLLETYILFAQKYETHQLQLKTSTDNMKDFEDCLSFLKRHSLLFSQWPALFVQTALNEPCDSSAHLWAESMTRNGGVHTVKWLNCTDAIKNEASELVSTFHSEPSCVGVSPDGKLVAVGTGNGTIHFLHTETGQEVKSLMSSVDGISSCAFLGEELLVTTSFDGQVEVWDVASGCRTAHVNAHSSKITGCDVSPDRKLFATVSLDLNLKVWSAQKSTEVASLMNPSPLNCVNFDLEGQLVAVGCWDGAVRLWNWLEQKNVTTLLGHQSSVRSLSFSPCSSMLCSGCLSGEVRLWSVAAAACVGSYYAHHGSTQSLNFLQGGNLLLSAGHDSVVHVWSGGLGKTVAVLGEEKQKRTRRGNEDEANALCVAVAGGYAAVGYQNDGIRIFSLKSGEKVWSSEDLPVSMLCLMWMEAKETELLLSGGMDHRLRVWESQGENPENLVLVGSFGVQKGPILALAQNSTCVASASDDFTIALWLKDMLTSKPWIDPKVMCILRGHNGGVTCLAFSPDGKELLSGGKDQALMIWKVNASPPVLSQSISNCHGDWITGCAWTSSAVLSCSSKLRMWDIQTGRLLREILSSSSLSTLCCWEDYVMAGSTDGLLMVWKWESGVEITRIQAHKSRLHHCTVVSDLEKNLKPEDLLVASASEDGTVKLWHPLQVQHHNTLHGHSAEIQSLVCKKTGPPEFLTVSADRSLRSWSVTTAMETPRCQKGIVRVVYFLGTDDLMVCGYDTGRLEIWHQNSIVYCKKVSDGSLCAVTGMPDDELAVSCSDCSVCIWKLERDSKKCIMGLDKVSSYKVESPLSFLFYCGSLFGVYMGGTVTDVLSSKAAYNWLRRVCPLGVMANDSKSFWLLGQKQGVLYVGLVLSLNPSVSDFFLAFCDDAAHGRQQQRQSHVQHHNTLHGHSAEIQSLVCKKTGPLEFLTVSADRSLRSWSVTTAMETPRCQKGIVRVVYFLGTDDLMVCGYDTGRLEIWHQNSIVYCKKLEMSE